MGEMKIEKEITISLILETQDVLLNMRVNFSVFLFAGAAHCQLFRLSKPSSHVKNINIKVPVHGSYIGTREIFDIVCPARDS